jgi:hypothetical protein
MSEQNQSITVKFAQAVVKGALHQREDAQRLLRECVEHLRKQATSQRELGVTLVALGNELIGPGVYDERIRLLVEARDNLSRVLPSEAIELAAAGRSLSTAYFLRWCDSRDEADLATSREITSEAAFALGLSNELELNGVVNDWEHQLVKDALGTVQAHFGSDSVESADAIVACQAELRLHEKEIDLIPEIRDRLTEALPIYIKHWGADDERLVKIYERRGRACGFLRDFHGRLENFQEALRILEKIHGPISVPVYLMANKLRCMFREGSNPNKIMCNVLIFNCPVTNEIQAAAKWWGDQLRQTSTPKVGNERSNRQVAEALSGVPKFVPTEDQIAFFQQQLEQLIAMDIDQFPYQVQTDYGPSMLLAQALRAAGIPINDKTLPFKSGVKIEVGKVTGGAGYREFGDEIYDGAGLPPRSKDDKFAGWPFLPIESPYKASLELNAYAGPKPTAD